MSQQRYFTVTEANALLPALEVRFQRILQLRSRMREAHEKLQSMGEMPGPEEAPQARGASRGDSNIDDGTGSPEVRAARGRFRAFVEALTEEVRAIEQLGVSIKDLDTGLCDFLALREGREVWLCWRLGEKRVDHWHDLTAGFAGRQLLDDDEADAGDTSRTVH